MFTKIKNYFKAKRALSRGLSAFDRREYEKAVEHLTECVQLDPGSSIAHQILGRSLYYCGRLGDSLNSLTQALEKAPDNPYNYFFIAYTLYSMKNYSAAMEKINEALTRDPGNPHFHYLKGLLFLATKDLKSALPEFDFFASLESKAALTRILTMAELYLQEKKGEETERIDLISEEFEQKINESDTRTGRFILQMLERVMGIKFGISKKILARLLLTAEVYLAGKGLDLNSEKE